MAEIVTKQGVRILVDDSDVAMLSAYSWYAGKKYATGYRKGEHVAMHQLLMPNSSGLLVDHKNRNPLDNRRRNLRLATALQNAVNVGLRKDNTSGYKGVTWNKQCQRWKAQIRNANKRVFLGYFSDPVKAGLAYDLKAKELFGEYACLNFPH